MNYKVMQRPMFKLGGKAASQGTGITSGLDERVNYSNGAFGTDRTIDELKGMDLRDLLTLQTAGYDKSMQGLQDLRDIVKLQTLGNLATGVLPNIESRGLRGVVDFFQDPMTTQQAISGLTGLKKVDLREKELQGTGLDKFIKGQMAVKKLDIDEQRALTRTATQIKLEAGDKSRQLLEQYNNDVNSMPAGVQKEYFDLRTLLGDLSPSKARQLAVIEIEKRNREAQEQGDIVLKGDKYNAAVDFLTNQFLNINFAEGGRVERRMGSPMMGEQPMANPMAVERKDVAMETQGQGNDAYAMLRARLPQEIPDDVVRLIAYNKEAFADFASIKNQEDVTSFNQKYNVSMNIDVSTV